MINIIGRKLPFWPFQLKILIKSRTCAGSDKVTLHLLSGKDVIFIDDSSMLTFRPGAVKAVSTIHYPLFPVSVCHNCSEDTLL